MASSVTQEQEATQQNEEAECGKGVSVLDTTTAESNFFYCCRNADEFLLRFPFCEGGEYVLRVLAAYRQVLQSSYKSVSLSLAGAFGFREDLLDLELSRFTAVKQLHRTEGRHVVETCAPRHQERTAGCSNTGGDSRRRPPALLTQIHKLSLVSTCECVTRGDLSA